MCLIIKQFDKWKWWSKIAFIILRIFNSQLWTCSVAMETEIVTYWHQHSVAVHMTFQKIHYIVYTIFTPKLSNKWFLLQCWYFAKIVKILVVKGVQVSDHVIDWIRGFARAFFSDSKMPPVLINVYTIFSVDTNEPDSFDHTLEQFGLLNIPGPRLRWVVTFSYPSPFGSYLHC